LDWSALHKAAITAVVPPEQDQALVMDARFVPKSGQHTDGLDRFWNGSPSRAEQGLEISTLAWLDSTDHGAYSLSVAQTPPRASTSEPEATRMEVSCDQLSRVVQAHDLRFLRYVVTDGAYSQQQFVAGVRGVGLHQIGTWRADAHRRSRYQGPKHPGPGRHKTSDGKGNWSDVSRFERLATADEPIVLYPQVLNHGPSKRHLQVVVVVHTQGHRDAVRFSTAGDLKALRLYRDDKARLQIECLFRDAKQLAGLRACQARSPAKRDFHCNASLSAVTFAKLEARHQHGNRDHAFSRASLKRRAFNQHFIERICAPLANGQSLEKSSPGYEALCNDGVIAEDAA
jgi:hypothetical protein